jgi:DNA-binding response OmpR family regulator
MPPQDVNQEVPARVLVVDDDVALTKTLIRVLSSPNIQVEVANDGQAGLAQVRQYLPNVVIVDFHMPDMDGIQFIDACRAIPECADVPVLLATGEGDTASMRRRIQGKGVVLIVPKPFDLDMLITAVRGASRGHARHKHKDELE